VRIISPVTDLPSAHAARCPFDHTPQGASDRKSRRAGEALTPPFEVSGERWTIRSFRLARGILREGDATRQAGFGARTLESTARRMRPPILYQEGAEHKAQRTATARFFTPQTVGRDYRALMEALSDELVADLKARGEADLGALSMKLSVRWWRRSSASRARPHAPWVAV